MSIIEQQEINTEASVVSGWRSQLFSWKSVYRIFLTFIVIGWGGYQVYSKAERKAILKNNAATELSQQGDKAAAIQQFQSAYKFALSDETKGLMLMNLGYTYLSNENPVAAAESFQKIQSFSRPDSFYFLIAAGELANIQGNTSDIIKNFEKAYERNPKDFQVNNSLTLFYLDLDEKHPEYADYTKGLLHAKNASLIDESESTQKNLGIAYYLNEKYPEALTVFSQMDATTDPQVFFWMGLAYSNMDNDAKAQYYYLKASQSGIEVPPALMHSPENQ